MLNQAMFYSEQDGTTSFISKDCQWRNYNLSIHRETQFVDTYGNTV